MKYIAIIAVGALIGCAYLQFQLNDVSKRLNTHEEAFKEMAGVMIQAGIVIKDQDGKPIVNTLLREAVENNRPQ